MADDHDLWSSRSSVSGPTGGFLVMSFRDTAASAVKRLPARLTIVRDDVGGLRRLRLYGTLDPQTAPLLGAFLPPHCRVGSGPVILDLAGLQTLHRTV